MSVALPPIVLFPGGKVVSASRATSSTAILNVEGKDIRPALAVAVQTAGIPMELALACAIAESGLNPKAERWGGRTEEARGAIRLGSLDLLRQIIRDVWPDISFGYGQRVVAFHWAGDRQPTAENCIAVRDTVFSNPGRDLLEMARKLNDCLADTYGADLSPVGGDCLLGALVAYNAGHIPAPGDSWWEDWAGNVAAYRWALAQARGILAV